VLQRLIDEAEPLKQLEPYANERDLWKQKVYGALVAAFGQPHQVLQDFDGFAEVSSVYDTPRVQLERQNEYLGYRVNALKSAVYQLELQLPETQRQSFFRAGSQHDAYVEIRGVISKANTDLLIVDSHVDGSLWQLLKNVSSGATIRVLTAYPKADFLAEARTFSQQYRNKVEAKTTRDFHDRFIFLDAERCWHLGASIKDAGAKAFLFSEITDPRTVECIWGNTFDTWNAATVLL
jgi:hypothetical protein